MPLSDKQISTLKPREKPYPKADGGGLYIEVQPSGAKLWRLKCRYGGKQARIALGAYPGVSLKLARDRRRDSRPPAAQRSRHQHQGAKLSAARP